MGDPSKINQFRPISLCNVLYKIISKVLVNRMQSVLPLLIGPIQGSFLPGRLITDNIVLTEEVVHTMKRKRGTKGWMLLKLDLEKAYDRLRWDFVVDTLSDAWFPNSWIRWIEECISSTSFHLLWNGEATDNFVSSRGLRQGDPISPYLFVLCIERLSHLINHLVQSKIWKHIRP